MRSGLVVTDDLLLESRYRTSITELLVLLPNLEFEFEVVSSIVENANGLEEKMEWFIREWELGRLFVMEIGRAHV